MDYSKAIEIAPNIYWVGYVIPDDPFQCHVYLIKNGDESILIDPGSMITFPVVLEKITSVLPLKDIKYIIMHHQDPDIVGCYSTLEKLFPKGERYILTHWRSQMLLKHYQWETPFYLVDENGWKLIAGERELEFIFTPYAHFPGAFCTYDKKSEIVFSSDLFGGLTPEFELFAKSADEYFEYAKLFHKHYIPNKEILRYTLNKFTKKDISMIAPQHGSIIKKEFIKPLINKLKDLECGLYLMDDYYDDVFLLNNVDETLNNIFKEALITNSFENLLKTLYSYIKEKVKEITSVFVINKDYSYKVENYEVIKCSEIDLNNCPFSCNFVLKDELNKIIGELIICYDNELTQKNKAFLDLLFKKLINILGVAFKKEIVFLNLKKKEGLLYEKSVSDALTGLYNRGFLIEFLEKKLLESQRYNFPLSAGMIDIDFFKKINDNYGHLTGDCVLRELALLLKKNFRGSDIVTRYGGEEFLIVMPFTSADDACKKMEKFRKTVQEHKFGSENLKITISAGVTEYNKKDDIFEFIKKADDKLYEAKKTGRNRVIC